MNNPLLGVVVTLVSPHRVRMKEAKSFESAKYMLVATAPLTKSSCGPVLAMVIVALPGRMVEKVGPPISVSTTVVVGRDLPSFAGVIVTVSVRTFGGKVMLPPAAPAGVMV